MFWIGFDFVLFPKSAVIYDVGGGAWPLVAIFSLTRARSVATVGIIATLLPSLAAGHLIGTWDAT